jgi:hypothetical protein
MTEKMHPGLRDLRQKVKEVMIPLLVEVFEAKLAAQGSNAPISRLQPPSLKSREQICKELEAIHQDIKLLLLWGQSCEKQVLKALEELNEKPKTTFRYSLSSPQETNPDVSKSFSEALGTHLKQPPKVSPSFRQSLAFILRSMFKKLAFRTKSSQ